VLVVRLMLATLLGKGTPDPSHLMTKGLLAPAAPPPLIMKVNDPDLLPTVMLTVTVLPLSVAVRESGGGIFGP
jgi:hypothetical protein